MKVKSSLLKESQDPTAVDPLIRHEHSEYLDKETTQAQTVTSDVIFLGSITGIAQIITPTAWGTITGNPTDQADLSALLAGYTEIGHSHGLADVTGLVGALAAKAGLSHSHAVGDITNLQVLLDAKADTSHAHAISDITDLATQLSAKSAIGHQHNKSEISDLINYAGGATPGLVPPSDGAVTKFLNAAGAWVEVIGDQGTTAIWGSVSGTLADQTDLQAALNLKADTTALAGYALLAHAHDINSITGLQSALDGKVDDSQVLTNVPVGALFTDTDTTDHTALSNVGTNTHSQIDTHIADVTLHYTMGSISITESQISDLGTYTPEAPSDGTRYARKDAAWVALGDYIEDASSNGRVYGRKDGAWVDVVDKTLLESQGTVAVGALNPRWYPPANVTITGVRAYIATAPTGAALTVDLDKNGVNIQTITIADGANTAASVVPASPAILATDYLSLDVTQVGSTVAGEDLVIEIEYRLT